MSQTVPTPPVVEDLKQEAKIEPSDEGVIAADTVKSGDEILMPTEEVSAFRKISVLDYNAFQMLLPMKLMPKIIGARAAHKHQHVLDPFKCEKFGCENSSLKVSCSSSLVKN